MFAVPEEVIKHINRIVFKFLWRGQDRVARTAMTNSYENGGLRVLDFETSVKCACDKLTTGLRHDLGPFTRAQLFSLTKLTMQKFAQGLQSEHSNKQ